MGAKYGTTNELVSGPEAVPVCRTMASLMVEDDNA